MAALREQRARALAAHQGGDLLLAERQYREILGQHPGDGETWHYLAVLHGQQGRPADVVDCCGEALRHGYRRAPVYANLGLAERELGHGDRAATALQKAVELDDCDALLVKEYAELLRSLAREGEAIGVLCAACERFPGDAELQVQLGRLAAELNEGETAAQAFAAAVRAEPDAPQHYVNLGNVRVMRGDTAGAATSYRQALRIMPDFDEASWYLAQLVDPDAHREFASAVIERASLPGASAAVQFAAARMHDRCRRIDEAFAAYTAANRTIRDSYRYSVAADVDAMARLGMVPDRAALAPPSSGPMPVFVVGMPRSGSTLLEQMLGGHRSISAGGEIVWLQRLVRDALQRVGLRYPDEQGELPDDALFELRGRYLEALQLRSKGLPVVIDKLPGNLLCIPTIRWLFPESLIVHVRRDPLETCWSCFRHLFTGAQQFAYDLGDLGAYHRAACDFIDACRARWPQNVVESHYERLVAAPEAALRDLLERLRLDWDPRCLSPQDTGNVVMTASAAQVREGTSSTPRLSAAAYATHLEPLVQALRA